MLIRKIYICGKVTGLPVNDTISKFAAASDYWAENGYHPVNPIDVVNNPHAKWETAMHKCIHALLDCQSLYVLPDWQSSRGAKLEITIAHALGIEIILKDRRQQPQLKQHFMNEGQCICITAAAKYRCRHANGYDQCDLETNSTAANGKVPKMECPPPPPSKTTNMDQYQGLPQKLLNAYCNVPTGKAAAQAEWKSYEAQLKKEAEARDHNGFPHIIETHYGNPDNAAPGWFETFWVKLCMLMLVLACLPWIIWQFVKHPEQAVKLPFID